MYILEHTVFKIIKKKRFEIKSINEEALPSQLVRFSHANHNIFNLD